MGRTLYILLLLLSFASTASAQPASRPFLLGYTEQLPSKSLNEDRTINIYLPEGYNESDTARYPVIYLLDGGADEDFIHVVGLIQFNNFSWIGRVPKSIVVGIGNMDRVRDLTFASSLQEERETYKTSGGSARFISFLSNELQPYIDKKYRTNGSRMLIGQSLGGLLAAEILLKHSSLFDKYMIISPSLWWSDGVLLKEPSQVLTEGFHRKTDVYIAVGKEGLTPGKNPRVMELDANLLADRLKSGKSKSLTIYFDYLPEEDHATIMHQAVFNGLRALYPKKKGED